MTATISLPNTEYPGRFQTPATVGAKTIMLNVNYVGCTVSIAKTNERYFSVVARTGLRGMDVVAAQVWHNPATGNWVGDYFDQAENEICWIGQDADLNTMLHAAANNVSWRGHENGQW